MTGAARDHRPAVAWRGLVAAFVVVGSAGCTTPLAPQAFDGSSPVLRPEAFFAGVTRSTGVQEDRSGAPTRRFRVEGHGTARPDGALRLDQTVVFDGEPPQSRTWVLRPVDAHRYEATLTDASGPVEGEAWGNVFHLSYPMRAPIGGRMEQWLYLQPDGRTVVNEATISVAGLVVARLSERIGRDD